MAYVSELKCGCIVHELAGYIRKCEGTTSRSLSGRMASKPEGAEKRHNDAADKPTVNQWTVANILP